MSSSVVAESPQTTPSLSPGSVSETTVSADQVSSDPVSTSTTPILEDVLPLETHNFDADIQQLMHLIVNAFYSKKDIFLRELVSNASDALDKIRYNSLTNPQLLENEPNMEIRMRVDKANNTLVLEDTGIGMTYDDLMNNLGTIANSGTKKFMESLKDGDKDMSMIGQFGVGFYSAFLVADKVQVYTKHNDSDFVYLWESNGGRNYMITKSPTQLKRGTRIVLHLKDDSHEFLDNSKLKELVQTYSGFISFPVRLWTEKTREVEVEDDDVDIEDGEVEDTSKKDTEQADLEGSGSGGDSEVVVEDVSDDEDNVDSGDTKKTKKVTETYNEYDTLNNQKPIWYRNKDTISEAEYTEFYKNITNDYDSYLEKVHFSVEGALRFNALLFIPKRTPFNMFQQKDKKSSVKLYVRRVFISDSCKNILPEYMNFVTGLVDSADLPLNVSRELLQQNRSLSIIKKQLVKRIIKTLVELSETDKERFTTFYNSFHKNLKLGVYQDAKNRDTLASLLRYPTTVDTKNTRSLDQYVEDMKDDQPGIYYVTGEGREVLEFSPFIEKLKQKGYEVIFMVDTMDEYMVQQLRTYKGKNMICVTKGDLKLKSTKEEDDALKCSQDEYKELCAHIKSVLGEEVEKVVISNRVVKSPTCLVTNEYGWSANMERIMKAQALQNEQAQQYMKSKKTMEINPTNKIIKCLKQRFDICKEDLTVRNLIWVLYEQSLIVSGFSLKNPIHFTDRLNDILEMSLENAPVKPIREEDIKKAQLATALSQGSGGNSSILGNNGEGLEGALANMLSSSDGCGSGSGCGGGSGSGCGGGSGSGCGAVCGEYCCDAVDCSTDCCDTSVEQNLLDQAADAISELENSLEATDDMEEVE